MVRSILSFELFTFLFLAIFPVFSFAEDLCESPRKLRDAVTYCHENFSYIPAASACRSQFRKLVKANQEKLKNAINTSAKSNQGNAQDLNFKASDSILKAAEKELSYLISYGKQVHTEIEDYVYDLVLPLYDETDYHANINQPEVKQRFMQSECYGTPVTEMEKMESELRLMIRDLELTKRQVALLRSETDYSGSNLENLTASLNDSMKNNHALDEKGLSRGISSISKGTDDFAAKGIGSSLEQIFSSKISGEALSKKTALLSKAQQTANGNNKKETDPSLFIAPTTNASPYPTGILSLKSAKNQEQTSVEASLTESILDLQEEMNAPMLESESGRERNSRTRSPAALSQKESWLSPASTSLFERVNKKLRNTDLNTRAR